MKKIAVLTSGGDAPAMNAAIRAVVRTGIYCGMEMIGVLRGYEGLVDGHFIPMDSRSVAGIIHKGGTILHTSRCPRFLTEQGREIALEQMRENSIDALVVIGGDGSFRGAWELHLKGFPVVGIPGTIDNDIAGTDETIGYDTALNTSLCAISRLRDTASSHDRLFIVEVMGRDSGFLALEVGLASGADAVLIPELETDLCQLIDDIHHAKDIGKDHFIVILAEGVMAGHELKGKLLDTGGYDARVSVLGYIVRGGDPTCYDIVLATRMGVHAVDLILEGKYGLMVGSRGQKMISLPLKDSWERKKMVKPEYLRILEIMNS